MTLFNITPARLEALAARIEAEVEREFDDPCARLEPGDFDYVPQPGEAWAAFEFEYFCIDCGALTNNINGTHDICASCFYNPYDDGGYEPSDGDDRFGWDY